jgi:glycosyltransferase involved in cell wall biosynthesis
MDHCNHANESRISFIVPAYNEEAELPATLRAILKAAVNVGCRYEIVVVDDASTDDTAELARQFGARVVSISRRQIAAARNAGARVARGDIFIFVDADTHIDAKLINGVFETLERGCAGGGTRVVIAGMVPGWARIFLAIFSFLYFGLNYGAGAFLFTTRANFYAIDGFDEKYFAREEVFFTIALRKLGRFEILRTPVFASGRKLRLYSPAKILRGMLAIVFAGPGAITSRRKLHLWYEGERENSKLTGD